MFSGIKSMLFYYNSDSATNEPIQVTENATTVGPLSQSTSTGQPIKTTTANESASTLLEQTLNAATTKFTEQLLPPSASIEQLQSSSRQLLPTLNEQHLEEEEEAASRKRREQQMLKSIDDFADASEDEDDCFNPDSWEMLDLVENQPEVVANRDSGACSGSNLAVQLEATANKAAGGILKPANKSWDEQAKSMEVAMTEAVAAIQPRTKPRVSFEEPEDVDLDDNLTVSLVDSESTSIVSINNNDEVKDIENESEDSFGAYIVDENCVIETLIEPSVDSNEQALKEDDCDKLSSSSSSMLVSSPSTEMQVSSDKKAPVQVRPVEPERQPGWQLRRKRSKRRPLGPLVVNTCSTSNKSQLQGKSSTSCKNQAGLDNDGDQSISAGASSGSTSARSTPTLIDRIGSSIVANLTNLTNGFPASGSVPMQTRAAMEGVEKMSHQSMVKRSNSESNLIARRRLSKAYLSRQNDCVKVANSSRRADRRLKMNTTPNGISVNRKVQTSFH